MIAVDTNILVHAHRRDSNWFEQAGNALRSLAESETAWCIPWPCVHEFLSVVTHPQVFSPPSTLEQAFDQLDAWAGAPAVSLIAESGRHLSILKRQMQNGRILGARTHDARIAALCLSHGVTELWSADRDFSRFPDLTVRNPLV